MVNITLGEMESRFADIIWENPDVPSGELVKLCAEKLEWKKSTTYTMLRRRCDKGIFQNENGIVRCLMTKDQLAAMKGDELLKENYGGSLPKFLAAFADRRKISSSELDEIQKLIDDYRKDNGL